MLVYEAYAASRAMLLGGLCFHGCYGDIWAVSEGHVWVHGTAAAGVFVDAFYTAHGKPVFILTLDHTVQSFVPYNKGFDLCWYLLRHAVARSP